MYRQDFRRKFHYEMRRYMRTYFIRLRGKMELTREQMAELLQMDTRTYADKENGTDLCGLITFIALLRICPDKSGLLNDVLKIFTEVLDNDGNEDAPYLRERR